MSDLLLGQPTNLTVVSSGTGGAVRVTYAPWELDWGIFALINVGHWLANTTTASVGVITAKGGAENLGYWFEIAVAFPNVNWNTGNRISPQRQAATAQFATFAAGVGAMAADDFLFAWYANAINRRSWRESVSFAGKPGSVWGMLSRNQIGIGLPSAHGITYSGDLSAMAQQQIVANLWIATATNFSGVIFSSGVGQGGFGIRCTRLKIYGGYNGINIGGNPSGICNIDHCQLAMCAANSIISTTSPLVRFCSAMFGNTAFSLGVGGVGQNLVASECSQSNFPSGAFDHCASTDGTPAAGVGNLLNQDARTQLKFFFDNARPGDKAFPFDLRIHQDSVLRGAGAAIPGLSRDLDNQLHPEPPSIGAYEPYHTCYAPAAELVRGSAQRGAGA